MRTHSTTMIIILFLFRFAFGQDETTKVTASDLDSLQRFGAAVDICGDRAIIGADQLAIGGDSLGKAYVFERSGTTWLQIAILEPDLPIHKNAFAASVAINGTVAAVGARWDDTQGNVSGIVYVFQDSGGVWSQTQILLASDGAAFDNFGRSVAMSGELMIIGATGAESAYIFRKIAGQWIEEQKLTPSDAESGDFSGHAVDIDGNYAIVGAWGEDFWGSQSGAAYIFEFAVAGGWTEKAKLVASDGGEMDWFGKSVSISGNYAVAGAEQWDNGDSSIDDTGAIYLFERIFNNWIETAKLIPADAGGAFERKLFGKSVGISGNYIVCGAEGDDQIASNAGAAYLFQRSGNIWQEAAKFTAADGGFWDFFGNSVAIDGDCTIAGAYRHDIAGSDAGAAYVYCGLPSIPFVITDFKLPRCCTIPPDPIGPLVFKARFTNPGDEDLVVRRWVELTYPTGRVEEILAAGSLTLRAGRDIKEQHEFVLTREDPAGQYTLTLNWDDGNLQRSNIEFEKLSNLIGEADNLTLQQVNGAIEFHLEANYPNPFNPATDIEFQIAESGWVDIKVYNILGQWVKTILSMEMPAGTHTARWDSTNDAGRQMPSGVYFYQLRSGEFTATKRMLLTR